MNFSDKKEAYLQLQDPNHLEPDRELLAKKAPHDPALKTGIVDKVKSQCEILWALLDVATVEEITASRPAPVKVFTKDEVNAIAEEAGKLTAHIHTVKTLAEKDILIAQITELANQLPGKAGEFILRLPLSIIPNFVKKDEAEKELLAIDLETATQPQLANIARSLKLETPYYKSATLRPLLLKVLTDIKELLHLKNMQELKIGSITYTFDHEPELLHLKNMQELKNLTLQSHSDQVIDMMNAEKEALAGKVEDLEAEKEDLETKLEYSESEKDDLETERDDLETEKADLETENEDLQSQLDEEKKSEAAPDLQ